MRYVRAFLSLVAAVLVAFPASARPPHPLMWVVKDRDSTVYLFGSIHVMKDGVPWLTPRIRRRFDSASELWLEVADLDDDAAMQAVAQRYDANPAGNMTQGLSNDEIGRLDAILRRHGLSTGQLMGMKKWMVGMIAEDEAIADLGYQPRLGVDRTLLDRARQQGKPVHGFETAGQQMAMVASANDAEDLASLRESLKDIDDLSHDLPPLFTAWEQGDEKALDTFLVAKFRDEDPDGYRKLIVARNAAWEPQIETILNGRGTAFVAVGAAHLVGPDGLIALLKAHGIAARQLP